MFKKGKEPVPELDATSSIELHETIIHREEGRRPMLGCTHSRAFLEATEEALEAVEAIRVSPTLEAAEKKLEAEHGEVFDLVKFATLLLERGFVRSIDGEPYGEQRTAAEIHPNLYKIRPEQVRFLREPATLAAAGILFAGWTALLFLEPSVMPSRHDLLIGDRPGLNLLAVFGGLIVMSYLHELAHFFVARSYGLDATISLSHRFYLLVLHTDVTNSWTMPRRTRMAIFSAGIVFNLTVASVAGISLALLGGGHPGLEQALRYLIQLNLFPLIFQLFLFARTDLYHMILVLTKERNLAQDSLRFLRFRIWRAWKLLWRKNVTPCDECGRTVQLSDPFCFRCGTTRTGGYVRPLGFEYRSRRVLLGWSVVQIIGPVFATVMIMFVALPFMIVNVLLAYSLLQAGISDRSVLAVAEAALALLLVGTQAAFIAMMAGRRILGILALAFGFFLRTLTFCVVRFLPRRTVRSIVMVVALTAGPVLKRREVFMPKNGGKPAAETDAEQAADDAPADAPRPAPAAASATPPTHPRPTTEAPQ